MSDPSTDKTSPDEPVKGQGGGAPVRGGDGAAGKSKVTRVEKEAEWVPVAKPEGRAPIPVEPRRDFFTDAMKEMLTPFAGLIEKRLQPLLNAIEAIPTQAEKWGEIDVEKASRKALGGALDQLHARLPGAKNVILPIAGGEKKEKRERRFLRPPGAMVGTGAEGANDFESVCSRCGMCVEACPASAIKLDSNGLAAGGFPYIVAEEQPCVVCDELACMKSCPTGALKLVDRLDINMGTAKVDHATCLRDRGEPCTLCLDACPVRDGDLSAIFASPTSGKIIVRKNICIGCGLCEAACPTEPRSVKVIPFEADREPIVA